MLIAILAMTGLSAVLGLLLGYSAIRFRVEGNPIADQIDALLPQTQCGQCGHPGCRPYAEALARGEDEINKCVPGGEATLLALRICSDASPQPSRSRKNDPRSR